MSSTLPAVLLILALFFGLQPGSAREGFSSANAYATVRFLAEEIGPRPMGSPAEQRALAYAVSTFIANGCDTAYIMPMRSAGGINTASGIAVGILRGATGRMIVLGSHLDSSAPEVPGANDNASGTACVLELSRVLGSRDLQSTIVFACFGGEEEGLLGSKHFVEHFPQVDSVVMMLQIDMTDGATFLELDPDAGNQVSAPRWLTAAAMEEYSATPGFENLLYLTHSATLNASTPGGTGSDHHAFLEKGIPALCLSSDVGYPIHTPLDNMATFDSSGLSHSGNLVLRLVGRFDGGVPSRSTEKYYLLQFGDELVFLTHPVLLVFIGLSLVLAVVAFMVLRRRRLKDRAGQPRLSGLKLALFALIVQAFVWLPESVVGLVKGLYHPWVNDFFLYAVLGGLAALVGVGLVVRLASRWGLQADPFPYYVRVFILLVGGLFGAVLLNPELGVYAAWPLFWLSLGILLRPAWLKGAAFVLSASLPFRMVFTEALPLVQRGFSGAMKTELWRSAISDLIYIGVFMALSLPFVYGLAALYRDSRRDLFFLKRLKGRPALLILAVAVLALGGYLAAAPDYGGLWQKYARIEQRYVLGADTSTVTVSGSEGVGDVTLTVTGTSEVPAEGGRVQAGAGEATRLLGTRIYRASFAPPSPEEWLSYEQTTAVRPDSARPDSLVRVDRVIDLYSPLRPLSVDVRYRSDRPMTVTSSWALGSRRRSSPATDRSASLAWYAFPEMPLRIPVHLRIQRGQSVIESVEVSYDTLAAPVRASAPLTLFRHRLTIVRADTLRAPGGD